MASAAPISNLAGEKDVVPNLILQIRSLDISWINIYKIVAEYLVAGVPVVYVFDSKTKSLSVFEDDKPPRVCYQVEWNSLIGDRLPFCKAV
jgi:hypothetical protein